MRLIILDFDGTVGDTRRIIVKTLNDTLRSLNIPVCSEQACAATIGLPLKQAFKQLVQISDTQAEQCAETYHRLFCENNRPGAVSPFPNTVDTIKKLHAEGYIITIASSRGHDSLAEFVCSMGLSEQIKYILGADDIINAKPHPEPVLKTLEAFGCRPDETMVVGDTVYDINMGRRAGVRTCGVTYGNGTREELQAARADYIIDDFSELSNIINDIKQK